MATAFFKMSRSIRRRSFSRRRRVISEAESGAECGAGAEIGRSADPAFRPSLRLRQLRSIEGEMPNSLAICSNGRPLLANNAIASRLNSSVNCAVPQPFDTFLLPPELSKGVHQFGAASLPGSGKRGRLGAHGARPRASALFCYRGCYRMRRNLTSRARTVRDFRRSMLQTKQDLARLQRTAAYWLHKSRCSTPARRS
jgi:hypothetical protein